MRAAGVLGLVCAAMLGVAVIPAAAPAEELPVPSFGNNLHDAAETAYIKQNFPWGLYAWPSFSHTAIVPDLDWKMNPARAEAGIASFKREVDGLIQRAREERVQLHLVLCSGLARGLHVYRAAKEEDIRNAQWYNDNNLASDEQVRDAAFLDKFVFGTLSRYARKVRRNLEAKARAAFAHIKRRMDENPDIVIVLSGWGEAELNYHRIDHTKSLQDWFCDFSPFSVLEFRDWIRHEGMYAADGPFGGEGMPGGGEKYQGAKGLEAFNRDYGTVFTTWDLRYFHWSLDDAWDDAAAASIRPDSRRIPLAAYRQGMMMPTIGPDVIPGGFDPPRKMKPGDAFWTVWNNFRETMVHNFARDAARWASEAGIPADRWYSHQLPGDYLFGTFPEAENKNARYYTSASPLWTADVKPFGSAGATIYDIKFPQFFARSTDHPLPVISAMTPDWAILEYDAETYPPGFDVKQSPTDDILAQFLRIYRFKPHIINFWRWQDATGEHRIKGMNKEEALRRFVAAVRDKARRTDLDFVFDPPRVSGVSAERPKGAGTVRLKWSVKIWKGRPWEWKGWGDFSHFEILRGQGPDFPADAGVVAGTSKEPVFVDGAPEAETSYYRVRAVNVKRVSGPASEAVAAGAFHGTDGWPVNKETLENERRDGHRGDEKRLGGAMPSAGEKAEAGEKAVERKETDE
jgi:hypothetical protein